MAGIGASEGSVELEVGTAPSVAMAMTYMAMADSLGLAMANAVDLKLFRNNDDD